MTVQQQRDRIAAELRRLAARIPEPVAAAPAAARACACGADELRAAPARLEPIAIIGLAGQFPGCASVGEFWQALAENRRLITPVPAGRFAAWTGAAAGERIARATAWGGFIPNLRGFDAAFFGVLPGAADYLDPRQRLLLLAMYHSLEDAGYAPRGLAGRAVGVFVGIEEDEYFQTLLERGLEGAAAGLGGSASLVANQLSYTFDLRGPSEVVNTMCSGGAVALHRAVLSLRAGESAMAVVGGVNLLLRPETFLGLADTGQLSADGVVRSFGRGAAGFVRAEGVVSVVLKPLAAAERDGDPIHALIRHSAVNFNGHGGMSMAAPDIAAHASVMQTCYRQAGLDPRRIGYIEAQGMGNPVADLGEWQALNRALRALAGERSVRIEPGQCRVSTLKPMMGHMHAASALGALCKIVHAFRSQSVPPIAGFTELNPDLVDAEQPCRPVTKTEPWLRERGGEPRVAGLHSYGAGGNNVHVVCEEYVPPRALSVAAPTGGPAVVLPFSAPSPAQRVAAVRRVLAVVKQSDGFSLPALAKTLQDGRDALRHRVAFVAHHVGEWIALAEDYVRGAVRPGAWEGEAQAETGPTGANASGSAAERAQGWVRGEMTGPWPVLPGPRLHLPGVVFALREHWCEPVHAPRPAEIAPRGAASKTDQRAEEIVAELLCPLLKVAAAELAWDRAFRELGFDSVLVARLAAQLGQRHDLHIEPARFFEFKTPRAMARAVAALLTPHVGTTAGASPVTSGAAPRDQQAGDDAIAIIGVAGRYPGAETLDELWTNLESGRECITEVPADRWDLGAHFDPDPDRAVKQGKCYAKWGGFIRGLNEFDALFFKISPREAETMNPKERLVLQAAWHALEDAGYAPSTLAGRPVGVFVGATRAGWEAYPGTFSSIPNRVSYFFDFRGPSVPIDTMCSSSLVALHEACRHLQSGECELALAGGVNLYLDPSHFAVLAHGRFLSPDGHCRAFGAGANGMVPGEGVGTVVLKPLARALADGDRIYGVIRASATNHGGGTNGFTVPNPEAQRDVIVRALADGPIDPRTISYVEAHGTGTVLGDPIEVRGLTEAYRKFTNAVGYCRLGSLKGNLGHLEAAAGIAGLTKVLLQFKHGRIAPSLHAADLNPNIDFAVTPFVVAQTATAWAPGEGRGVLPPRRAAVSSFGAGGSNAHVILEAFESATAEAAPDARPQLVVLSAKNLDRLQAAAAQLERFVAQVSDVALADLAYTLQVGREAMEERLALLVRSVPELQRGLRAWREGGRDGTWSGRIKPPPAGMRHGLSAQDWAPLWNGLVDRGEYAKLAALWVEGAGLDWSLLHRGAARRRISLPLYPFAREALSVPDFGRTSASTESGATAGLHPLLHRNTSTLTGVRFSSVFSGDEFFLAGHVVQGQRMLPAAAYLELARAAFAASADSAERDAEMVRLTDVLWPRPFCVDGDARALDITLTRREDGRVAFAIASRQPGGAGGESSVHAQGNVASVPIEGRAQVDLAAVRQRTNAGQIEATRLYAAFASLGIAYGSSHQPIAALQVGADEVLARLRLPPEIETTREAFSLHPSIVDGALQATMGFALREAGEATDLAAHIKPSLPYAVEAVEVFGSCATVAWAVVRRPASRIRTEKLARFDVELCDDGGAVMVRLRGFGARVLEIAGPAASGAPELLLRAPSWVPLVPLRPGRSEAEGPLQVALVVGSPRTNARGWTAALAAGGLAATTVDLAGADLGQDYLHATQEVLRALQALLAAKGSRHVLLQVVVPQAIDTWPCVGLVGLLRTVNLEAPRVRGQLLAVGAETSSEQLSALLRDGAAQPHLAWIRATGGGRERAAWQECPSSGEKRPWRDGGVYLITGGLGGLGRRFAAEIATRARGVRLVLVGRSALSEAGRAEIARLGTLGATAEYRAIDLSRADAVGGLVREIVQRHGQLNGVLHAAGAVHDQFILKKTAAAVEAVFGPKVAGTLNLDRATAELALDFFSVFSSGAVLGNAGQGDYAAANAFLDAFAHERNERVNAGQRQGATLSINWPFWAEGGMRLDATARQQMAEATGLMAMETARGFEAFYRSHASGLPQVLVLHGQPNRVLAWLAQMDAASPDESVVRASPAPTVPPTEAGDLAARMGEYLKHLVAETLKIRATDLEMDKDLAAYGLDSILVLDLNNQLERAFPRLSKTLFFEYATLGELARYFLESHHEIVAGLVGRAEPAPLPRAVTKSAAVASAAVAASVPPPPAVLAPPAPAAPIEPATPALRPVTARVTFDDLILRCGARVVAPANRRAADAPDVAIALWPGWHAVFQSFGLCASAEHAFSFSRIAAQPESAADHVADYLAAQVALRQRLFAGTDFGRVRRVVDLGCGHAADLIELAEAYPQIEAAGYTIDAGEADFARRVLARHGLGGRVGVHCADCTRGALGSADLIFSIQVMHFIAEPERKRALLKNVATALTASQGELLMAEFVSHLKRPIKDAALRTTVHTAADWAEWLAEAGLCLTTVTDVSDEVVNFLRDSELEHNVAGLPPARQEEIRKFNRQINGLENRWVSYCLLRATPETDRSVACATRMQRNLASFEAQVTAPASVPAGGATALPLAAYAEVMARFRCDIAGATPVPPVAATDLAPRIVHEDALENDPVLSSLVREIDAANPPIGYERLLYAHRFIMPAARGYVRLIRDEGNRLLIPLLPMAEALHAGLVEYARNSGEQILLVDTLHEWMRGAEMRLVPLGVVQTLELATFTLAGTRMRKLRYLVNKFGGHAGARTVEFRAGDEVPVAELTRVMLAWGAVKKNVITSTVRCMEHLLAGELPPAHRAFFTHAEGRLCSAIVIARCGDGAFLMDQEFYDPESAPLGHMEFAVVALLEQLKSEGARYFSLGVTWYPLGFDTHPAVEAETWAWVREQGSRATLLGRIFEQGRTNYQFKKKFGVEGELLFAYLPRSAPFGTVLHYWSAFYQHSLPAGRVAERIHAHVAGARNRVAAFATEEQRRQAWRAAAGFEKIPYSAQVLDLMSDTWFGREAATVRERHRALVERPVTDALEGVRALFPFRHLIFTPQGRDAEALFYGALPKIRRRILSAIPWTSTLANALGHGFEVVELPEAAACDGTSDELFRGGMDLARLEAGLADPAGEVGLVALEVLNNGTGGHPVRLQHVRAIAAAARARGVPLVLDASRIVRNAVLLRQHASEAAAADVWSIVRDIARAADHVVMSLTKDFGVPRGGLIATNDDALAERIRASDTSPVNSGEEALTLLGAALADRNAIERLIGDQLALTRALHDRLVAAGVPLVRKTYGHALVLDASRFCAEAAGKIHRESLLREIFVTTGIRGGLHQAGRQRHTVLDRALRFAFPLGLGPQHASELFAAFAKFFAATLPAEMPPSAGRRRLSSRADLSSELTAPHRTQLAGAPLPARAEPIAIIGLGGKFPGGADHHAFWEKIHGGENLVGVVPADRWDRGPHLDPSLPKTFVPHQTRCQFGAFVDGHDRFDAAFFKLADAEVVMMDPQERLALEAAWSCVEDAGYTPESLSRDTGLFSGVTYNEYQKIIPRTTHSCFLTSRIAYHFNFRGPAMAIDTGCASSVAAIDAAVSNLRSGACPTAMVIGANLLIHADHWASLSQELSSTDRPESRPFGVADGWIPAEGVVAVLLKPLSAAQRDRDQIHAVIASSRVGQEGKTSWFAAPSPKAQAALIAGNFERAGMAPATISHIEAAANGSALGDAIELEALATVFAQAAGPERCPIGTVKSNLGHGEGVSTLLQLAKVLLQFQSGKRYPLIHRDAGNPNLRFTETPFRLLEAVEAWDRPMLELNGERYELPRRATISSFGGGGNMGHLILEEAPLNAAEAAADDGDGGFVPISADTPERLLEAVAALDAFFVQAEVLHSAWRETYLLRNIMATLCEGRRPQTCRVAFVAGDLASLRALLARFGRGENDPAIVRTSDTATGGFDPALALARGAWTDLAQYWVNGGAIAWGEYFAARGARRVSLPTRRFAGRRFEISAETFLRAIGAVAVRPTKVAAPAMQPPKRVAMAEESARHRLVRAAFAKALRLAPAAVDFTVPLESYGFDSTMVVTVAAELEKTFRRVSPVLFFECETIRDVLTHLETVEFDAAAMRASSDVPVVTPVRSDHAPEETTSADRKLDELTAAIFEERLSGEQILRRLNGTGHANGGSHHGSFAHER